MEVEQVLKRLEWVENQRMREKGDIAALEERIILLEGALTGANLQIKELSSEVTHLKAVLARVDHFDATVAQQRVEFSRAIEDVEKRRVERDRQVEEVRRIQIEGMNNHILELRKGLEPIPELQNRIQARVEQEYRLARQIEELKQQLVEARRNDDEWVRSLRLLEEGRRRNDKQLTDIQGEALAVRKRADEHRGRIDLAADGLRKLEIRVNELAVVESERREAYNTFFEKQRLIQAERDRKWKEWQARFETVEDQAMELEGHLQTLYNAERDVKRAQEAVDDIIERVERRINEITEMQRLSEDRFRQEWVTFKADDQKRWTNYSLTQDEQSRDSTRRLSRFIERITLVEDSLQEIQDVVHQADEQTERRLQSFLAMTREWVADYERVFGRARV